MEKILSIVIPSYNTEKYIDECLPTMLSDSFIDEIEILIINDGSKDNTAKLAQKYVDMYPNSIRLINKENGGHGSVLNRGIKEATGKYYKVIDGDDWVKTEGLENLVVFLKTTDADMILNPIFWYHVGTQNMELKNLNALCYNTELEFEKICDEINVVHIHGVTYKTSILRDNGIMFQENCFYEDQEFDIYPQLYIDKIVFLEEPVYVYRIGEPTQSINIQNVIRNKNMSEKIISNLINYYNGLPEEITEIRRNHLAKVISRIMNNHSSLYLKMPFGKNAKKGLKEYFDLIKAQSTELYNYNTPTSVKLMRKDSWFFYTLAYVVFKVKRMVRGF